LASFFELVIELQKLVAQLIRIRLHRAVLSWQRWVIAIKQIQLTNTLPLSIGVVGLKEANYFN